MRAPSLPAKKLLRGGLEVVPLYSRRRQREEETFSDQWGLHNQLAVFNPAPVPDFFWNVPRKTWP